MAELVRIQLDKTITSAGLEKIINALSVPADLVVISGYSSELFCGGADLRFLLEANGGELKEFFSLLARTLLSVYNSQAFVLTVAKGKAVGGALGFIAAADCALADSSFRWRLSEVSLGFGPYVIAPFLHRIIGYRSLIEIASSGRWVNADESKTLGLVMDEISEDIFLNQWFRQAKRVLKPRIDEKIFESLVTDVTNALQQDEVKEKIYALLKDRESSKTD